MSRKFDIFDAIDTNWGHSGVFINFKHISIIVFIVQFEQVNAGWAISNALLQKRQVN